MSQGKILPKQRSAINQRRAKRKELAIRSFKWVPSWVGKDLSKTLAWRGETITLPDGRIDSRLISKGMDPVDIIREFPKQKSTDPHPVNLMALLGALIVEEYRLVGKNREWGNVRHFMYTNVMHTLKALGIKTDDSVLTSLDKAWTSVTYPDVQLATYAGMNIFSAKDRICTQVPRHSPNLRFILCVEKEDYFDLLRWIAQLFGITLVAGGGHSSQATFRALVRQLKEVGSLDRDWVFLTITDLDPAGVGIEGTFVLQFEEACHIYGFTLQKEIEPIRLFLRVDQVTSALIRDNAIPISPKSHRDPKKAKINWKKFWTNIKTFERIIGKRFRDPNNPKQPIKIEMNAIGLKQIEHAIVTQLLQMVEDETLMMVPEVMAFVETIREEGIKKAIENAKEKWFKEQKETWREPIVKIEDLVEEEHDKDCKKTEKRYRDRITPLINFTEGHITDYKEKFEAWEEDQEWEADEAAADEIEQKNTLEEELESLENGKRAAGEIINDRYEREIARINEAWEEASQANEDYYDGEIMPLEGKLEEIEEAIEEIQEPFKTEIKEKQKAFEESRTCWREWQASELVPYEEEKDAIISKTTEERDARQKVLEEFENEHDKDWKAVERDMVREIQTQLSEEALPIWFSNLEQDPNVRKNLTYLLEDQTTWEQGVELLTLPQPRFNVGAILTQAAHDGLALDELKDKNALTLTPYYDPFPSHLKESLTRFVKQRLKEHPPDLEEIDVPDFPHEEFRERVAKFGSTFEKKLGGLPPKNGDENDGRE